MTTVADAIAEGRCTAQCLTADPYRDHLCSCPCAGALHGFLASVEVELPARRARRLAS